MGVLEIAISAILLFVTIEQAIAVAIFLWFARKMSRRPADQDLPSVLVVLALRGCDATLSDCLRALFRQEYPRYRVRIMVDHRTDPAWEIAEKTIRELSVEHVDLRALESPGMTCTLKCTALYQATAELDPTVDVVAFLDSDVTPSHDWLRQLVAPLADPRVEATMGNRWYRPYRGGWGSITRYLWNISAVVNMFYWQVPWGGTLAVKADVLRHSKLRSLWTQAGCDDVPLFQVLQSRKRRLAFVPSLLLTTREEIRLHDCLRFISRQFLWVRLYHPVCWWICAIFHAVLFGAQVTAIFLIGGAAAVGRWEAAAALGGALVGNFVVNLLMMWALERYAARVTSPVGQRPPAFWLRTAAAVPLAEVISLLGFALALFTRHIEWRGIRYRVAGPWKIRMLEYFPIRSNAASLPANPTVQPMAIMTSSDKPRR